MRVNERFEMLEDKIRQLEKEVFELKTAAGGNAAGGPDSGLLAADVPNRNAPAAAEETNAEEAGTAKKARTTRAKKTSTK